MTSFDLSALRKLGSNGTNLGRTYSFCFCQDGKTIVSAGRNAKLKVGTIVSGSIDQIATKTLSDHTKGIRRVRPCADGNSILTVSEDGSLRFWRLDQPEIKS